MDTDLIVTTLPPDTVVAYILALPGARQGNRGVIFAGQQEVTAAWDPDGTTNVVVYDQDSGALARKVFDHLSRENPSAGILLYDASDEVQAANHAELIPT